MRWRSALLLLLLGFTAGALFFFILEGGLPGEARGSWLFTARRTYYDLVAERIVDENLPSFGDLQARVNVGVGESSTLTIFGLHSREDTNLDIVLASEARNAF